MTKDEALQMCLEYIETDAHERKYVRHAIKAALEVKVEPVAVYGYCPVCGAKGTSRERHPDGNTTCVNGHKYKSRDALITPPQQEAKDEPAAWMYPDDLKRFETSEAYAQAYSIEMVSPTQGETVPLYTTPPQRKPLTDEEIDAIVVDEVGLDADADEMHNFARAIEAKLKEKNG
jgi:hypothetical protein